MGIDLLIAVVAIIIGIVLVRVIKGKDGELRFLRNSGLDAVSLRAFCGMTASPRPTQFFQ